MNARAPYFTASEQESPLAVLDPADARNLRAKAWRHIRRINSQTARRIWLAHRRLP